MNKWFWMAIFYGESMGTLILIMGTFYFFESPTGKSFSESLHLSVSTCKFLFSILFLFAGGYSLYRILRKFKT